MMNNDDTFNFDFILKTEAKIGAGKFKKLKNYLLERSYYKIGIILDPAISELPYVKEVISEIKKDKSFEIITWIYDLQGEPDYDSLDRVKNILCTGTSKFDCFIGIGGGSAIDFAKGMATLAVNPGESRKYRGFPEGIKTPVPTIAIPTTAGTGSEVTYNAVFIDKKSKIKLGINTKLNYPVLAILDPILTLTCPPSVSASSGMDALVHTIESYSSPHANWMSKIYAREAFELLYNNLPKVVDEPSNVNVRAKLQLGAYLAAISLRNSSSSSAEALSYPLGVHFNVPHGIAGAIFLPHVIKLNVERGIDYSELFDLIENKEPCQNKNEKNISFSKKIFELEKTMNIPSMHKLGVSKENLQTLLDEAEKLEESFSKNSFSFTSNDAKELLKYMITEK